MIFHINIEIIITVCIYRPILSSIIGRNRRESLPQNRREASFENQNSAEIYRDRHVIVTHTYTQKDIHTSRRGRDEF